MEALMLQAPQNEKLKSVLHSTLGKYSIFNFLSERLCLSGCQPGKRIYHHSRTKIATSAFSAPEPGPADADKGTADRARIDKTERNDADQGNR
jgi:hypothetical protein